MAVLAASLKNKVRKHKTESEKMVRLVYIDTVTLGSNDCNQSGTSARPGKTGIYRYCNIRW